MRTTIVPGFAALVLASGCLTLSDSTARVEGGGGDEEGELDRDDCKIEDGQIGTEGTILRLGSRTVTFHDWIGKAGSTGEFVGFSITVEGSSTMSYVVKSGIERHASSDARWLHPASTPPRVAEGTRVAGDELHGPHLRAPLIDQRGRRVGR